MKTLRPALAASLAAILFLPVPLRSDEPDLTVPLPAGETPLAEIGAYRVFWQSYGEDAVEMPVSWSGHFDPQTGISYLPWGRVLGRDALLVHSPWRVRPGKTWIEFRLALPAVEPILLSFGTAMGPDVARPARTDRSDGVTFSAALLAGGEERELLRRHQATAEWNDERFDLSDHAGKTVVLRLGVEPGPANDASFDYSFFGDAKLHVAESKRGRPDASAIPAGPRIAAVVDRLTATRAYAATSSASVLALSNTARNGVAPSNLLPAGNRIERLGDAWRFVYEGDDCRVVYTWRPATGTLDDVEVRIDDGRPFRPALGGGAAAAVEADGRTEETPLRGGKVVEVRGPSEVRGPREVRKDGKGGEPAGALRVTWEHDVRGKPLRIAWTFGIAGKALIVEARCDDPRIGSFSLGSTGPVPFRKTIGIPYLAGHATYLSHENVFVCRYLDWTISQASSCPQGAATYEPKTDGTRNPLLERGYVAVSPDIGEVLPNIPHPPSPWLSLLGPRILLDIWGHHRGTFAGDAENLRDLEDNGVDHLAIISHDWQCHGYDVKLPDHLPANARYGGDEGMKAFGEAANDCGYVWSLHENYIDLYPDAPSYDPEARVLRADGSPSPAWFNAGTGVQSFGLKCNRALEYAKANSPEIHRRFGTTAAYLDVHTCVPPWHQLDHEAGEPMAAMALAKVRFDTELFRFQRETHEGPLLGEGANHFYWAGLCDGVEAQVAGGEDHQAFLDFDLLKIHPQMVNHGMGYYERWFRAGYGHELGRDSGSMDQIDKYRAQEVAYGHAGFIGSSQTDNVQWVAREHHLMHPVQRLYGASRATEIRYEVAGSLVTASVALVAGEASRQRIRYESGLTVWVNWRAEPWVVEGRVLPQWGFLALGPDTEVSTSLQEGRFADLAECPEYLFVDARTHFHMPYLRGRKSIEPRIRSFEHLGGSRAEVTYEWIVDDVLDDDYHCFVHGLPTGGPAGSPSGGPADGTGERIAFQGDHRLPRPTSSWRKGETIVDGPHSMSVADDAEAYDLVMGLFKGSRVRLKGVELPGARILVARLRVEREGGEVTRIALEKVAPEDRPPDSRQADFTAHLNPEGTRIDFGKVATDGSVKIEKGRDRLEILPYPRGRRFEVRIDLAALLPAADPARVRVRAVAAGARRGGAGTGGAGEGGEPRDPGPADFRVEGRTLTLTVGTPGAGRYIVSAE